MSAAGLKVDETDGNHNPNDMHESHHIVPAHHQIELPDDEDDDEDDDSEEKEEEPPEDKIFAEFTKVNRTRMKFKCDFKNAILHINGHDYVIKNLQGDIDY